MNMQQKVDKKWLKTLLPIGILAASIGLAALLISLKPEQEKKEHIPNYPKVETFTITREPVNVMIDAQGTVRARQQTKLTARVSGHIEWVSPEFYEGGSFKKGEILLKLDPLPYSSALAEARSRLALAEATYLQEQEAAEQAKLDWQAVGSGEPSPLVLRKPQLEKAKADLEAAEVSLKMATENLSYTEIRAPYDGRVESKYVDVGQAITAQGTQLADIFSTEAMEIPLAVSLDDLAFIKGNSDTDIPSTGNPRRITIELGCEIASTNHSWKAYLDRTAASIDVRTRMITAYARMDPPFDSNRGLSLKPGMFVSAQIQGRVIENASRIPRSALQPGGIAYKVDENNRLESVKLEVVRTDANWAIVTNGLKGGDRLCLTPLLFFVEGMRVEPTGEEAPVETEQTEPAS